MLKKQTSGRYIYQFTVQGMNGEPDYTVSINYEGESHLLNLLEELKNFNTVPENLFALALQLAASQTELIEQATGSGEPFGTFTANNISPAFWTLEALYGLASAITVHQPE